MNLTGRPIYQKPPERKHKPLRDAAEGENCTLRLDCCNYDPSTTIFAHYRHFGWAGTAQKPNDLLGCFACSACHDAIDGRRKDAQWGYDDLLRAMGETLMRQMQSGNLEVTK